MGIGRFVYTPILPAMAAALDLSGAQGGLIAAANVLGYLAGALAASAPRLPGSRRAWLLGALAGSAGTTLLMAGSDTLGTFLALRFVAGVASAFALVFASALVLDRLAQAGRSGLSAVHFAGVGVGIAVSSVTVSAASDAGFDWRGLWVAAGLLSLVVLPAVALLVPPEAPGVGAVREGRGRLTIGRPFGFLLAAYFLFGLGYIVTATFLMTLVRGEPSLRAIEPAVWLTVGLAAIPSVAIWNVLGRRLGTLRAMALALVVEAAGVAASAPAFGAPGILAAAALLGATFIGITALGIAGARAFNPAAARQALALMTALFGLGSALAPPVAGLIADVTGEFTLASHLAAGALVAGAACAWAAHRSTRRGGPEPAP
ncbi:YbfB/YjiJ family MFS transporter [Salinarimonas soli]|uniref:YbfB/YjiJ family MFS transporter n=2 Tax=Salinarimonas soli TaxID=1638099 RepID=A0A5B2V6R2_9HYPH|nr:YbfB/YjiJ family MFS transporter [Salinarimonas soli]